MLISCALLVAAVSPQDDMEGVFGQEPLASLLEAAQEAQGRELGLEWVAPVRDALWVSYVSRASNDEVRRQEHDSSEIHFRGKVMRFASFVRGDAETGSRPLFIALHGGGGAPARVNDSQWEHMKVYYRDSVDEGVYVAVRGITDTWNLHSVGESFAMYDRLIENMIVFEGVDPNQVYVLGFSAGGDGTYQIAPRMSDRLAAANMSAGHHNGISPRNLYRVPFLLQVGEKDTAYNRHRVTVEYALRLASLQEDEGDGYVHELFVHAGQGHNFRDNDARRTEYSVLEDPEGWLEGDEPDAVRRDTNAIAWLRQHRRDPLPTRVIWDTGMRADRSGSEPEGNGLWDLPSRDRRSYWLGLPEDAPAGGTVVASYDRTANRVIVEESPDDVLVLLSTRMVDFTKPVQVLVGGTSHEVAVSAQRAWMLRTLFERGDPHFMFEAALHLRRVEGSWTVELPPAVE